MLTKTLWQLNHSNLLIGRCKKCISLPRSWDAIQWYFSMCRSGLARACGSHHSAVYTQGFSPKSRKAEMAPQHCRAKENANWKYLQRHHYFSLKQQFYMVVWFHDHAVNMYYLFTFLRKHSMFHRFCFTYKFSKWLWFHLKKLTCGIGSTFWGGVVGTYIKTI